jgi:hypothetical protein
MKRPGPPFGSGPDSDTKLSDAGERTHTRSDAGRASRPSLSPPSGASKPANSPQLLIYLEARGRERFDALSENSLIVTASTQAIGDAARALHRLGYADELVLVVFEKYTGISRPNAKRAVADLLERGIWKKLARVSILSMKQYRAMKFLAVHSQRSSRRLSLQFVLVTRCLRTRPSKHSTH